ncbi:MAG: hypothetical protein C0623_03555 [Desulfuromonas sp.]|nr:MAG: hypothetical protein C0623_03555 [Desulfuromonas sp.]
MVNAILGFTILLGSIIPLGSVVLKNISNGMYGQFFRQYPPVLYHLSGLFLTYIPTAILLYLIFKKLNIAKRIQRHYLSNTLFGIGNFIFISYITIRLFASTIEGGGASYAVMLFASYFLIPTKIILFIAVIRFLIGIEPRPANELIQNVDVPTGIAD